MTLFLLAVCWVELLKGIKTRHQQHDAHIHLEVEWDLPLKGYYFSAHQVADVSGH